MTPKTLRQILLRTRDNHRAGRRSLAVFDLDSTLFDVGPRLERILADFAAVPAHQARFPEQIERFKHLRVERRDWGIKNALERAGLDDKHPEFLQTVRDFWKETFFSNEYLRHDLPYEGAVAFVNALHDAGGEIAYLTGRDVARMGPGSSSTLKNAGFPLGERAELVLKPHLSMNDAQFKTDWFAALPADQFAAIWFFENEPVNIRHTREQATHVRPTIEFVFMDSTHSGTCESPCDLPTIVHYLLEDEAEDKEA